MQDIWIHILLNKWSNCIQPHCPKWILLYHQHIFMLTSSLSQKRKIILMPPRKNKNSNLDSKLCALVGIGDVTLVVKGRSCNTIIIITTNVIVSYLSIIISVVSVVMLFIVLDISSSPLSPPLPSPIFISPWHQLCHLLTTVDINVNIKEYTTPEPTVVHKSNSLVALSLHIGSYLVFPFDTIIEDLIVFHSHAAYILTLLLPIPTLACISRAY